MEEVKAALEKASLRQDARTSIAVLPFANLEEQALKADPLLPLNHYFMTRLQVCRGDYERAYEHARLAVEIAPHQRIA